MSGIITLTTDWGYGDPYAALFRAHVWALNPQAVITDISHAVLNGNRLQAAYLLSTACWAFPAGTVHVADVRELSAEQQRKVFTKEQPLYFLDFLAVACGDQYFLMENNGMLSLLSPGFQTVGEVVRLRAQEDYDRYNTFNALNYYVKAAASLAAGVPLSDLGEPYPMDRLERIVLSNRQPSESVLEGRVLHVDARGNLITDIRETPFQKVAQSRKKMTISIGRCFDKLNDVCLYRRYLKVPDGKCFALFNSGGYLELGQKNVSLAEMLYGEGDVRSGIGDAVTISFQ